VGVGGRVRWGCSWEREGRGARAEQGDRKLGGGGEREDGEGDGGSSQE